MDTLPRDMIVQISKYLSQRDISRLKQTQSRIQSQLSSVVTKVQLGSYNIIPYLRYKSKCNEFYFDILKYTSKEWRIQTLSKITKFIDNIEKNKDSWIMFELLECVTLFIDYNKDKNKLFVRIYQLDYINSILFEEIMHVDQWIPALIELETKLKMNQTQILSINELYSIKTNDAKEFKQLESKLFPTKPIDTFFYDHRIKKRVDHVPEEPYTFSRNRLNISFLLRVNDSPCANIFIALCYVDYQYELQYELKEAMEKWIKNDYGYLNIKSYSDYSHSRLRMEMFNYKDSFIIKVSDSSAEDKFYVKYVLDPEMIVPVLNQLNL
jgi:hypothetical protein